MLLAALVDITFHPGLEIVNEYFLLKITILYLLKPLYPCVILHFFALLSHLLPDTKTKVKTSVCKSSLLPSWDEVLSFPKMKQPDLVNSVLEVALCKHGLLGRSDTLGAVRVGFTAST